MFPQNMLDEAEALLAAARMRGWRITTAESCTGGLIAGLLTALAGSSDVVDGGAVTYSNAAKTRVLGVPAEMIVAGPGGGTATKPVGLVWFGVASPGGVIAESKIFPGDRTAVRMATVRHAMALLRQALAETTRYA